MTRVNALVKWSELITLWLVRWSELITQWLVCLSSGQGSSPNRDMIISDQCHCGVMKMATRQFLDCSWTCLGKELLTAWHNLKCLSLTLYNTIAVFTMRLNLKADWFSLCFCVNYTCVSSIFVDFFFRFPVWSRHQQLWLSNPLCHQMLWWFVFLILLIVAQLFLYYWLLPSCSHCPHTSSCVSPCLCA